MKTRFNNKFIKFGFLLTVLLFSSCAPIKKPIPPLTPIVVQLQYTHQAEFAGFYAADQNGYYAAEGLAVTFLQGGATVDHMAAVQEGKAQFGTTTADELIFARAQDKPLRAIATVFRRSPVVFISLADSGITRPQDFKGKTIRVSAQTTLSLRAMTAFVGLSPSQYTEVSLPWDLSKFASGDIPVWGMFINGSAVTLKQAGYKVSSIYPDDYGVHFYGDVVITTDEMIKINPDLVLRFLRATLKGWTFAVENPDKISAIVINYEPKADTAIENEKMITSLSLINTGEDHIGWMKPEIWEGMEKTMRDQGVLSKPMDVSQIYDMQFLEEIYK